MKGKGFFMHRAWLVFIGCCCLQAGGLGLMLNSSGVFYTPICQDLGFTQGGISLYLTFYAWFTCLGMVFVARWFPRFDTRKLMTAAAIIVIVATGLMSTYTELWQWYVTGTLYGLAGSFLFMVPAPVLLSNWFHKKLGLVTGIAMAASGIGTAIWSPLLTAAIEALGWRTSYLIAAGIAAVLILPFTLFVFRFKPEDIGLKPYGWTPETGDQTEKVILHGATVRKALPTVAFVAVLLFGGLISCCSGFTIQLPSYAISIDLGAMVGATIVSAAMIGNILSKVVGGFLSDLIGIVPTAIIQIVCVFIGFAMFAFLQEPWMLYVAAFLFGVQNGLVSVSTPMIVKDIFGTKHYTEIFSYIRIGTGIFSGIGIALVSSSYDWFGSYIPSFMIGMAIMAACLVCVLLAHVFRKKVVWE